MGILDAFTTADTVFKKNYVAPAAEVPVSHKLNVRRGTRFQVLAVRDAGDSHLTVTFDRNLGVQHWNTWNVFRDHIEIDVPGQNLTGDRRRVSDAAIALIQEFEGFSSAAYRCPAGVWTIGYGFTKGVQPGDTISEERAIARLREELASYERAVEALLTQAANQNQFDALVSLCFNIGAGAIARSSVIKRHNRGQFLRAADAFLLWNKGGGRVLPGLVRRRHAERALYLS